MRMNNYQPVWSDSEPQVIESTRKMMIRSDLKRAARVARKMGFRVDASRHDGRISSYYVFMETKYGFMKRRISDHDIPQTESRCIDNNYIFGADVYASDKKHRRDEWWERAFTLLQNSRTVPQKDITFEI